MRKTTTNVDLVARIGSPQLLAVDESVRGGLGLFAVLAMLAGAALGAAVLPLGVAWVVGIAAVLEAIAVALLIARADSFERQL